MNSLTYRLPPEFEGKLTYRRSAWVLPPANGFMHHGKLNMGPAILLTATLASFCYAFIFSIGYRLIH